MHDLCMTYITYMTLHTFSNCFMSYSFKGPPNRFCDFYLREIVNFVLSYCEIVNLEVRVIPETHIHTTPFLVREKAATNRHFF